VIRCGNCGEEVEEGRNFCPYCAQPLTVEATDADAVEAAGLEKSAQGRGAFLQESDLEPPNVVPLASFDERRGEESKSRRKLLVAVGVGSAVVLLALALLFSTDAGRSMLSSYSRAPRAERLEGAARPGTPEFDENVTKIFLDFNADENAFTQERYLGDVLLTMKPTFRNFTNRTVTGLEVRAQGLNALTGEVIKEQTYVVVPTRQRALEPNKTVTPTLSMEGLRKDNVPTKLNIEITGLNLR
jgi:hypothetical protein